MLLTQLHSFPLAGYSLQFRLMNKDVNNNESISGIDAYEQALTYMYDLINFEMRPHDRYMANKLDATRPQRLMMFLGNPHQQFPSIHIAGTKGKGSVAAMCASSLRAAGYNVGLYTSPHVQEFRERIRILTPDDADGRIPKNDFVTLMEEMKTAVAAIEELTWFEIVTGLAFLHFARQKVDIVVVEVGLGGRLDATNVLTPHVSVITSLSLDHTDLLGNTLTEIAWEKAGIIKPGVPVVVAPQKPEAEAKLQEVALERESPASFVGQNWQFAGGNQQLTITKSPSSLIPPNSSFQLALAGAHQLENATAALAALDVVRPYFPALSRDAIQTGLATVAWNGRLQIVHQSDTTPTILADCAHNTYSATVLRRALLDEYAYGRLWLIYGASSGKDISGMLAQLLPLTAGAIATLSSHPRAIAPEEIAELAARLGYTIQTSPTIKDAVTAVWQQASPNDLICVTGSIFVVGDLLNQWENLQSVLLNLTTSEKHS